MEITPKKELFCQTLVKNEGRQMETWLELHPNVKKASARANSSRMLADVSVRLRVFEILEKNGLGLNEVVKKLSEFMNAKYYVYNEKKERVLSDNRLLQFQGLTLILRLYDSLLKASGGTVPHDMAQLNEELNPEPEK